VCVAPTGSGKTTIGAELARLKVSYQRRVLWLAHRTELIDQAADRLHSFGLSVGVIAASSIREANPHRPVQVASVQTLTARGQTPEADLLIVDECHHQSSKTYTAILKQYPNAQIIGLTATPERADGKPLSEFQELITVCQPCELIDAGYLVKCEVVAPDSPLKSGQIARSPVHAYTQHTPDTSAIVFSPSVGLAELHASEFRAAGIPALCVEGNTPAGDRRKALEDFKTGRLRVLTNCAVLTEGTDVPICGTVILARGTGHPGLYIQMTGRALRPYPGKQHATLLDLRGISHTHGSPTASRTYSLTGQAITAAGSANPYPACAVCGCPKAPGEPCEECGTTPTPATLEIMDVPLVRYPAMMSRPPEKRAQSLAKWLRQAQEKGWKPGAAAHKYRAVFQQYPPSDVMAMAQRLLTGGTE
jgi:superfamily II DNA or RNA helicase